MFTLSHFFECEVCSFSPESKWLHVPCSQTLISEAAHLPDRRQMSGLKAWERSLIDIPKMPLLCSASQICILLSGVEWQDKCCIFAEPCGEGGKKPHSTSLFRVCIENNKHSLKGHPISSSRWIGKKKLWLLQII